ncbi:MAG: TetR family transcriptional regulator [Thermodesulfobacteriota bacterium]
MKQKMAAAEHQTMHWEAQEKKILAVAARLFWEKGYVGASIDEIAKKANMNKALIYYYFENKSTLLFKIVSAPLQKLIEIAKPIANSNSGPTEKLRSLITSHIKWQLSHLGLTGIGHVERKNLSPRIRPKYLQMRDQYDALFRKVIKEGIDKGEFSFPDAKMGSLFTLGLLTSIIQWYNSKGKYSPDEVASLACKYVLEALGSVSSTRKQSSIE